MPNNSTTKKFSIDEKKSEKIPLKISNFGCNRRRIKRDFINDV